MTSPHELQHVLEAARFTFTDASVASSFLKDGQRGRKKELSLHDQIQQRPNARGITQLQPAPKLIPRFAARLVVFEHGLAKALGLVRFRQGRSERRDMLDAVQAGP